MKNPNVQIDFDYKLIKGLIDINSDFLIYVDPNNVSIQQPAKNPRPRQIRLEFVEPGPHINTAFESNFQRISDRLNMFGLITNFSCGTQKCWFLPECNYPILLVNGNAMTHDGRFRISNNVMMSDQEVDGAAKFMLECFKAGLLYRFD